MPALPPGTAQAASPAGMQKAAEVRIMGDPLAGRAIEQGNRMDAILGKFSPRQRALLENMLVSYAGKPNP